MVLVTAGGTREALDPVRFIGNRSSGKMGYALAEAAQQPRREGDSDQRANEPACARALRIGEDDNRGRNARRGAGAHERSDAGDQSRRSGRLSPGQFPSKSSSARAR